MIRLFIYLILIIGMICVNIMYVEIQFIIVLIIMLAVPVITLLLMFISIKKTEFKLTGKETIMYDSMLFANVKKYKVIILYTNGKEKSVQKLYCKTNKIKFDKSNYGAYQINVKYAYFTDITGLFMIRKCINLEKEIIVFPQIIAESDFDDKIGEMNILQEIENKEDSYDMHDIRKYQEGDRINHIHWNATLKCEDIMVRHFEEDNDSQSVKIYLNIDDNDDISQNEYLSIFYTLGIRYIQNNFSVLYVFDDVNGKNSVHEAVNIKDIISLISCYMRTHQ